MFQVDFPKQLFGGSAGELRCRPIQVRHPPFGVQHYNCVMDIVENVVNRDFHSSSTGPSNILL
jgi:hypothetical protein